MDLQKLYLSINKFMENNKLQNCKNILEEYNSMDYINYIPLEYNFNNYGYQRIKLNEFSNNIFEFILIIWKPNSLSKIHDHPENGCLMKILNGTIDEHEYNNKLEFKAYWKLSKGMISYIEKNNTLHSISNTSDEFAFTLHIYTPPNYTSNTYN